MSASDWNTIDLRPEWTQEDASAFRAFWDSPAGRKLRAVLVFDEQHQNRAAVFNQAINHAYSAGFAAGFSRRTSSLQDFSAEVRPQQDQDSRTGDGADPPAERFAP